MNEAARMCHYADAQVAARSESINFKRANIKQKRKENKQDTTTNNNKFTPLELSTRRDYG